MEITLGQFFVVSHIQRVLVANPQKLIYTVANPARDLLGILFARKIKARTAERRWMRNSV